MNTYAYRVIAFLLILFYIGSSVANADLVRVQTNNKSGSGLTFICKDEYLVITNKHIIREASIINIVGEGGRRTTATLIDTSLVDLALLMLDSLGANFCAFCKLQLRTSIWLPENLRPNEHNLLYLEELGNIGMVEVSIRGELNCCLYVRPRNDEIIAGMSGSVLVFRGVIAGMLVNAESGTGLVYKEDYLVGYINRVRDSCLIGDPPEADFEYSKARNNVEFTDQSTDSRGIREWYWQFGDGSVSETQNPSHEYRISDRYEASLIVTNSVGLQDTISHSICIEVEPKWPPKLSAYGHLAAGLILFGLNTSGTFGNTDEVCIDISPAPSSEDVLAFGKCERLRERERCYNWTAAHLGITALPFLADLGNVPPRISKWPLVGVFLASSAVLLKLGLDSRNIADESFERVKKYYPVAGTEQMTHWGESQKYRERMKGLYLNALIDLVAAIEVLNGYNRQYEDCGEFHVYLDPQGSTRVYLDFDDARWGRAPYIGIALRKSF